MARGRAYVANAAQRLRVAQARLQKQGRGGAAGRPRRGGRGRGGLGGPAPMPWDSTAQRESAALGNEAADTRVDLSAGFDRTQRDLGFGVGADSPYSQSAENKDALAVNQRGITNAAGGQLYSGSTLNAQSGARSEYDKTQKSLEDSYAEAQSAYARGQARTTRDEQLGQAGIKEGAIDRAAASEPEPLGVGGRGRRGAARTGRGRVGGPGRDGRNVRRPDQARRMNAQARRLNAQVGRGRGRI